MTQSSLSQLIARRDLLYILTWREVQIKYKQSVMGILWAILMPSVIVASGVVVRMAFSTVSGQSLELLDLASVSVRALPWAFFVSTIRFATSSLVSNANLVTKIAMPRQLFPVAAMLSQLIDLVVASATLAAFLPFMGVGVSIHLLWAPYLVMVIVVFATALGILLSAASLFFRDVKYLVDVFLTFAIFFTPVFYEAKMFERWASVLLLNPIAPLLEGLAAVIVRSSPPDLFWIAYSSVWAAVMLTLSLFVFRWLEPYFAESV